MSRLLLLIIILAVGLRLFVLSQGTTFHYDMARDAYIAKSIAHEKELKIIGPPTDIEGMYHGVGYYYLLAIPHIVSDDPQVSAGFMGVISAVVGTILVYVLSQSLGSSKKDSLFASLFFAVSYEMVQYGIWLSNPAPAILTSILFFWGLWLWCKGDTKGFILSIISIALSLHFQLFLLYFVGVMAIFYVLYRPKITPTAIMVSGLFFLVIMSPFLIAEVKFGFKGIHAFSSLIGNHTSVPSFSSVLLYADKASSVIGNTLFPQVRMVGIILFIISFLAVFASFLRQKEKRVMTIDSFLLLWYVSNIPLFFFSAGSNNAEFSFVGVVVSILFIFVRALGRVRSKRIVFAVIAVIAISNLHHVLAKPADGAVLFAIQGKMTYQIQKEIADYTYQESKGEPFSLCTLTIPLFVNTTWAYLYETYGQKKYDYVPTWIGQNQVGRLGSLPSNPPLPTLRFLVYEPSRGLPLEAVHKFRNLENKVSTVVDKKNFGDFIVEKRVLHIEKSDKSEDNSDAFKRTDPANSLYLCGV